MSSIRELPYTRPTPLMGPARAPPTPARATHDDPGASPFARLVRGFSSEADRGEASVRSVVAAGHANVPLDPTSLLALQARIYRYGETMDLAAQLVDKASTGVKTIVQGQ
jgi:hypothetical protein